MGITWSLEIVSWYMEVRFKENPLHVTLMDLWNGTQGIQVTILVIMSSQFKNRIKIT
jgi:hypothetical protein